MQDKASEKTYTIIFIISLIAFLGSAILLAVTLYVRKAQTKPFKNPTVYPFVKGPTSPPPRL